MPDFTWRIEGLADLQRQLEDELPKVAKRVVRDAVNEGAEMMLDSMHREAPRNTKGDLAAPPGFLGDHLDKDVRVSRNDLAATARVGAKANAHYPSRRGGKGRVSVASVARFLEFGTSKMSANPFMTRSFDSIIKRLADLVAEKIQEGLAKVRGK